MAEGLDVVYEDNHIIVVIKPPGVISQADKTDTDDMLARIRGYIKIKYDKPGDVYIGLVHRLDKPVGGLMVFARTSKAASRLNDQQRENRIDKYYLAVVRGRPELLESRIEGYIIKDRDENISKMTKTDDAGAKYVSLSYRVLGSSDDHSLLEIKLHTGRSHQIRVQLQDHGFPLEGDRKYDRGPYLHHSVALWAYKLEFVHPVKKIPVSFVSLPEDIGIWKKFEIKELL
jgi:23S rRNA pseudouridine1911/1915/1917 synthase